MVEMTFNEKREKQLETIADYLFLVALIGVLTIILQMPFNFLNNH